MKHTFLRIWALALLAPLLAHAGGNGAMNKCVQGQTVVYTDKPCPSGQQVHAMTGGSISTTDAVQPARQQDPNYYYYQSSSGKPHVPYFAKQKSVDEALRERTIRR